MSKHTPGPWEADDAGSSWLGIFAGDEPVAFLLEPSSSCHCRQLPLDDEFDSSRARHNPLRAYSRNEEQEANARLIACAPDLLEECIKALAAWEGTGPAILLDDLRGAIAKATGAKS